MDKIDGVVLSGLWVLKASNPSLKLTLLGKSAADFVFTALTFCASSSDEDEGSLRRCAAPPGELSSHTSALNHQLLFIYLFLMLEKNI